MLVGSNLSVCRCHVLRRPKWVSSGWSSVLHKSKDILLWLIGDSIYCPCVWMFDLDEGWDVHENTLGPSTSCPWFSPGDRPECWPIFVGSCQWSRQRRSNSDRLISGTRRQPWEESYFRHSSHPWTLGYSNSSTWGNTSLLIHTGFPTPYQLNLGLSFRDADS